MENLNDNIIKSKGRWHNNLTKNIGFGFFKHYVSFGQSDRFRTFLLNSDIKKVLNEEY